MTHGDLLVKNHKEEGMEYWLHAYNSGHTNDLYEDLKSLPKWLAKRAVLECLLQKMANEKLLDEELIENCGSIGPWQLLVLNQLDKGFGKNKKYSEEEFGIAWRNNLGVNLDYCGAERIANLMALRHFDRWTHIDKKDAPWSSGKPDITVECNWEKGSYKIIPNPENSDDDEKMIICDVDFHSCLYQEFKNEYMKEN